MKFNKIVGTAFLQSNTERILLIIAVSIVMKGELANETVNYDTKTKAYVCKAFEILSIFQILY